MLDITNTIARVAESSQPIISLKPYRANFRFYEELNDFLEPSRRKTELVYDFDGAPAIKDPIEALGVPHSEVDLVLVNRESVGFDYRLKSGDRVSVYPVFESLDISPLQHLRAQPLRQTRFVVDVNLGKLARRLRMLGFDTRYGNRLEDREVVDISVAEKRIILTRDRRLLFHRRITHGYWVRSDNPETQLREVIERLDLRRQVRPLCRCLECNGEIEAVEREQVWAKLEPLTRKYYDRFYACPDCGKIYWEGSHVDHMSRFVRELISPEDV